MSQEHKQKSSSKTEEEVDAVEPKDLQDQELEEDVEDLLGEIDDVLEDNAQAFVESFVQQGGE